MKPFDITETDSNKKVNDYEIVEIVSVEEVGSGMISVKWLTATGILLVFMVFPNDWNSQIPCNVTPFPPQVEQGQNFTFINNEWNPLFVTETTWWRTNWTAPWLDTDADHESGVNPSRLYWPGAMWRWVTENSTQTIPTWFYEFERKEFPSWCIDTVVVQVVEPWVLPLDLIDSQFAWDGDDIKVDWTTANRLNTEETCTDIADEDWAYAEAGCIEYDEPNSSQEEDFSMRISRDEIEDIVWRLRPWQTIYLRLRNVDTDWATQNHPVVALTVDDDGNVFYSIIYPNPVNQGQNITIETNLQDGPLYISVINANWQEVMSQVSIGWLVTLQNNLPSGIYVARVSNSSDGSWDTDVQRFIVK